MVYEITNEDVERSSLELTDVGRWGFIVQGCWQLFDTEQSARMAYDVVFGGLR